MTDSAPAAAGRRLAAIMIADVVGYSRMMESGEGATHERLQSLRTGILDPQFAAHGGHVHRVSGDGFVVEFGNALAALSCALAIQRAFTVANDGVPKDSKVSLRVGINLGDIIVDQGEIAGNGVNVAARLETLCPPGSICISAAVRDQIHDDLGVEFEYIGKQSVKNIRQPVEVFRVDPKSVATSALRRSLRAVRRKLGTRGLAAAGIVLVGVIAVSLIALYPGLRPVRQRIVDASPIVISKVMPGQIRSVAVLPFDDYSNDSAQEYFAEGMTEALTTDLAKIGALRVISRTTMMRYKNRRDKSLPEIARELDVDSVMEGSVQRANGKVMIRAQLIRASNDEHIWADHFERDMSDVLVLQDDIARAVATQVRVTLTPQDDARLSSRQVVNPAAYEAYLKGVFQRNRWQITAAIEQFQEAMRLQPDYAQAYAGLALTYMQAASVTMLPLEARAKAVPAAERALALDPKVIDAHLAMMAIYALMDYDWPAFEKEAQYTIGLNPGLAHTYGQYGLFLGMIGRFDDSFAQLKRAREIDPISAPLNGILGRVYFYAGQYPESIDRLNEALKTDSEQWFARIYLAGAYAQSGRLAEAEKEVDKIPDWFPDKKAMPVWLAAVTGKPDEARAMLPKLLANSDEPPKEAVGLLPRIIAGFKGSPPSPFSIASIYVALGDKDKAFEWLERGYETRFIVMPSLRVTPTFKALHGDPRFDALLQKMNLEPIRGTHRSI
jgi:class 3 adenylate cyclase/TolB-like protein